MSGALIPECTACGACCTSRSDGHVPVSGDDYDRLGDDAELLVHWTARHAFMNMHEGRCIALGDTKDGVTCTIYERRPQVCRDLERGGSACAYERDAKTIPVAALVKSARRA